MEALLDGYVSLLRVKAATRNLLPHDSLARSTILAEDDALPLEEALASSRSLIGSSPWSWLQSTGREVSCLSYTPKKGVPK